MSFVFSFYLVNWLKVEIEKKYQLVGKFVSCFF